MTYKLNTITDPAPITVQASAALGLLYANATESDTLFVGNHTQVYWSWLIANLGTGPITEFRMQILWSAVAAPGTYAAAPEDWQPVLADSISSGLSTVDEYTFSVVVASMAELTAGVPASIGFTSPKYGLNMKTLIWAQAGAITNSDFTGFALRRA